MRAVERPELYRTLYTTQLELWELDDAQWHKVMSRPYERRNPPPETGARQLLLPAVGVVGLIAVLLSRCLRSGLEAHAGSASSRQMRTACTKAVR